MQKFGMTKSIMVCYGIFWRGQFKVIQDSLVSGFRAVQSPDSRNWMLCSFSVELGFRMPIVFEIQDSLS